VALHAVPFAIDAEPGQAREAAGRRVLLVGLDARSRKEASRWLASAGFEVAAVDDAASALPLLEQSRPDVVFADASLRAEGLRAVAQALRSEDGRGHLEAGAREPAARLLAAPSVEPDEQHPAARGLFGLPGLGVDRERQCV